jgi:mannose-1-phosphate guanylyltransferase
LNKKTNTWVVVLAGGEGSRLHSLTTATNGIPVPKQFCSLQGGPSLLQNTVQRALSITSMRRVCAVVAIHHRLWRDAQIRNLLDDNVIEQPADRGTAHGVLLPLLHVLARDPDASIVVLPADHYIHDEAIFAQALQHALERVAEHQNSVFLLGVTPDEPDTELGYIVPENSRPDQPSRVMEFVEKPRLVQARSLLARGALWNTFILASSGRALLSLYDVRFATTINQMRHVVGQRHSPSLAAIEMADVYRGLSQIDFSRDVLEGQEARLQVFPVPPCGWTDLGTPQRVAQTLRRLPKPLGATSLISHAELGLDLAAQQWRQEFAASVTPCSTDPPERA